MLCLVGAMPGTPTSKSSFGVLNLLKSTSPEAINLTIVFSTTASRPLADKLWLSFSCIVRLKKSSVLANTTGSRSSIFTLAISSGVTSTFTFL